MAQAGGASGGEAEVTGRGFLHEVVLLDQEFAGEGNLTRAGFRVSRIVGGFQGFHLSGGPVGDGEFQRTQHPEEAGGGFVQILAHRRFKKAHVGDAVVFRDADVVAEAADAGRRVTPSAQA